VPLAVAVLAVAVLGAGTGSLVALQATIRQERTPPALLPRVVGLSTGPVPVVGPVAVLLAGIVIDRLGIARALVLLVVGVVALGIGGARLDGVRQFDDGIHRDAPLDGEPAAALAGAPALGGAPAP
jgi:hypothetical protein